MIGSNSANLEHGTSVFCQCGGIHKETKGGFVCAHSKKRKWLSEIAIDLDYVVEFYVKSFGLKIGPRHLTYICLRCTLKQSKEFRVWYCGVILTGSER
jgi:hypothetical protein